MASPILPPEVLAHLITFISSPTDLLSVSLANHILAALAAPELDYYSIRCCLGNDALWRHLIAHPALASRVRRLEIMRENRIYYKLLEVKERVPEGISDPRTPDGREDTPIDLREVERSEKLLVEALHVLVNLERFTWDRWAPIINQGRIVPLELLEAGDGRSLETEMYEEDIWTVLRDHSQLRELKVVDLGHYKIIFGVNRLTVAGRGSYPTLPRLKNVYSIYESTMFTIENLTRVELKIYHMTPEENVGGVAAAEGNVDGGGILPGCVQLSQLHEFLLRCFNLQYLNLTVHNRPSHEVSHLIPFIDLTSLFAFASWPYLSTLCLCNICISSTTATHFLASHPSLRALTAHLKVTSIHLPEIAFSLDFDTLNAMKSSRGFLPGLEEVDLPPQLARMVLNALANPAGVRVVHKLEPCDWGVVPGSDNIRHTESPGEAVPEVNADTEMDLVRRLPGLVNLTTMGMCNYIHLRKLVDAAPQLEVLWLVGYGGSADYIPRPGCDPLHDELLPCLSKLRRLTTFRGIRLWRRDEVEYGREDQTVHALGEACPLLREVTWEGGEGVT